MLAAVRQLAESATGGRGPREPKGVLEAYRETYPVLHRFCHVDNVEDLAPLWARLARGAKSELQSILQQELMRVCTGRGLTPDVFCPAVTTHIKQLVTGLNFGGHGQDDITVGCQPFLVSYTGTEEHYRSMDHANLANQLDQGTTLASLADIREIREKEKVKLPRDLNQVSYTLRRYDVLVHVLFQGPAGTNSFVEAMWRLANTFNDRLPIYLGEHQKLRGTAWYDVYPAHIIRHVQVNVYEYFQLLQTHDGGDLPPVPDFKELYRVLQRGSFHISSEWLPLPPTLTVEPTVAGIAPAGMNAMTTRHARSETASQAGTTISGMTGTSASSSTSRGQRTTTTGTSGTYIVNPARDAEFESLQLRPGMRQLLQANPPPRNDRNVEFCVSWFGRGGCYSNCSRAATHCAFANANERAQLLAHVRTHLVASPASAAGEGSGNTT